MLEAGCDSVVDATTIASMLLVRSVQDPGTSDVVSDLLTNQRGSEIHRVSVPAHAFGQTYFEYAADELREQSCVIGIVRHGETTVNPDADLVLEEGDSAFVIARRRR